MKIIVTGSDGFIGKQLIIRLVKEGFDIVKLDIKSRIDITDWTQLSTIDKFDVLIHLASKTFIPDSFKYPHDFYFSNYIGTLNVLELCRRNNAKMIYASSYVYGTPEYLPINEEHPIKAYNPYAQTKIINEKLCEGYYRDFNVPITILRPFNIYGPGQNDNFLIPSIIKQAKSGYITLKDPRPKRDFIYIDDIIEAYIKAIYFNETSFEIFNIGTGVSYSVKEIVNIIKNRVFPNPEVCFTGEQRKNEVLDTVADVSKAKKELGWEPKNSISEGISKLIED